MVETVRRVVCDRCGKPAVEALESEDPIQLAKNDGWEIDVMGEDICPKCRPKDALDRQLDKAMKEIRQGYRET